jgi:N-acetyl-anhydromuramyl-L-alanine amidase AmpD
VFFLAMAGCRSCYPGQHVPRKGDEIMVAGQLFHTGAPVVLWNDPGGYNAYRTDRRFGPDKPVRDGASDPLANGLRYNDRAAGLSESQVARIKKKGWDLATLQQVVDQFVIHYDVAGTSRACFHVLQDVRGLSVHFMIDLDGTIYQTLDVQERAWHATIANDRSVGVEIANIGAYASNEKNPFDRWYGTDAQGHTFIHVPTEGGGSGGGVRTPGFIARPARDLPITGTIQGRELTMYDLTPQQYDSLTKLTAALCTALPRIRCDYPRDASGRVITHRLPDDQLAAYSGLIGHYHIQENKADPGPALQWDRVVQGAKGYMAHSPATY